MEQLARGARGRLLRRAGRGGRDAQGKETSTWSAARGWRARAAEHGSDGGSCAGCSGSVRPASRRRRAAADRPADARARGTDREADGVLRSRSRDGWAEATRAGASADRVRARGTAHTTDGSSTSGEAPSARGGPGRYSTAELVAVERAALALVERGRERAKRRRSARSTVRRDRAGRQDRLSDEQESDGARGLRPAEPGRLRRRARGRRQDDRHPRGRPGLRARRASTCSAPRRRVSPPRSSRTRPGSPPPRSIACSTRRAPAAACPPVRVLVVDEAGMAETRILAPVLELVEQANGKAILIGDPHQLPAVGAGGLFAGIVEREGAVVLTENRRQRDQLERDALARVRAGRRPRLPRLRRETRATRRLREPGHDAGAPARRLVGARPRRPRRQRHARPPPPRRRRPQPIRPRADGGRRPPRQGSRSPSRTASSPPATASSASATQTASASRTAPAEPSSESTAKANADGRAPTAARPSNSAAPTWQAGNVRHAYALTGHAAQGLTVERAFVLGAGEARLQEWGYVALSRARAETRLYVTGTPREHESHFHDLDDRDPLARFGRALEESAVEELAVDQRPLPSGPRHDARPEIERSKLTPEERMRRRLLEQKRRALTKTRDAAERRLETAERKLAQCGRVPPPTPRRTTPRSRPPTPRDQRRH